MVRRAPDLVCTSVCAELVLGRVDSLGTSGAGCTDLHVPACRLPRPGTWSFQTWSRHAASRHHGSLEQRGAVQTCRLSCEVDGDALLLHLALLLVLVGVIFGVAGEVENVDTNMMILASILHRPPNSRPVAAGSVEQDATVRERSHTGTTVRDKKRPVQRTRVCVTDQTRNCQIFMWTASASSRRGARSVAPGGVNRANHQTRGWRFQPDVKAVVAGEWGMRGGRNGRGVCAAVRESGHELGWRARVAGRAHGATGLSSPGALPIPEGR